MRHMLVSVVSILLPACFLQAFAVEYSRPVRQGRLGRPVSTCEPQYFNSNNAKNGTFSSPGYPEPYPDNYTVCWYEFQSNVDERIQIKFVTMDLIPPDAEHRRNCPSYETIELFQTIDGMVTTSSDVCDSDKATQVMSAGSLIRVRFLIRSNPGNNTGFLAEYMFVKDFGMSSGQQEEPGVCAFHFNENEKTPHRFTSPNYPGFYPRNTDCWYHFHTPVGYYLAVTITDLSFYWTTFDCSHPRYEDYLLLGEQHFVCGHVQTPKTFIFEASEAKVFKFHSNKDSAQKRGFEAIYEFVESTKFTSVLSKDGTFGSQHCTEERFCLYSFEGQEGERIIISFHDLDLDLGHTSEDPGDYKNCEDTSNIRFLESAGQENQTLQFVCGREKPIPFMSAGNQLTALFTKHSGLNISNTFHASFQFVKDFGIQYGKQEEDGVCRFTFRDKSGTLTSPNFPGLYPRITDCYYILYGLEFQTLSLNFTHFDVEGIIPDCSNATQSDYIEINDTALGSETTTRLCGLIHGRWRAENITSKSNIVQLRFHSNDIYEATGFKAVYQFKTNGLQRFTSDVTKHGVFNSLTFPRPYDEDVTCHYTFRGTQKERVQMRFILFDFGEISSSSQQCRKNVALTVYQRIDYYEDSNILGIYCGRTLPPILMSAENEMEIVFHNYRGRKYGFQASYAFVTDFGIDTGRQADKGQCHFTFNIWDSESRDQGTFTSPNFPGLYPRNTTCTYYFRGYSGATISFKHFDVDGVEPVCSDQTASDYLEYTLGMLPMREVRLCGVTHGRWHVANITIPEDMFVLKFVSNHIYDATGFEATYIKE